MTISARDILSTNEQGLVQEDEHQKSRKYRRSPLKTMCSVQTFPVKVHNGPGHALKYRD